MELNYLLKQACVLHQSRSYGYPAWRPDQVLLLRALPYFKILISIPIQPISA